MTYDPGTLVDIGDTALYVVERGPADGYPLIVLHGGPGLDHTYFGDYLDPLTEYGVRLLIVDQREHGRSAKGTSPETWTLKQHAADLTSLAESLGVEKYAALGHSYGSFVVQQQAVDFPGHADRTIVSCGIPDAKYLEHVNRRIEAFEPKEMGERIGASWEAETRAKTHEDVVALLHDQMPFHFADPFDPRIAEVEDKMSNARYAADVLRMASSAGYGGIAVEDKLNTIPQPVLVLAGRHDNIIDMDGARTIAEGVPDGKLVIFENSGHMPYVEENDKYVGAVRAFLNL